MRILSANASPVDGASWADRLGVWASAACLVHCLVTPFLLSFSVLFVRFMPSESRTHRSLAVVVALMGVVALARGFMKHRRWSVLWLMALGLLCIFGAAWETAWRPMYEVGVTMAGSVLMITAHRLNHTYCRGCACAHPH